MTTIDPIYLYCFPSFPKLNKPSNSSRLISTVTFFFKVTDSLRAHVQSIAPPFCKLAKALECVWDTLLSFICQSEVLLSFLEVLKLLFLKMALSYHFSTTRQCHDVLHWSAFCMATSLKAAVVARWGKVGLSEINDLKSWRIAALSKLLL